MGGIDILVNNAGVFWEHSITNPFEQWQEAWESILRTNLFGVAYVTYWTVQQMLRQGGGCIVNISSRGAFRGEPDAPAYGASKAGLNALSQSLAKALAPHNIIVTAIAPGWAETDMAQPYLQGESRESILAHSSFRRIATPEEVARTVLFLASEGVDFISGAIVDINGASYLCS